MKEALSVVHELWRQWKWQRCESKEVVQLDKLRTLLKYVWQHSAFYREFYSDHGIREKDLDSIYLRDLPFTNKELLMQNFDRVVTDPRLQKDKLAQWIEENPKPTDLYLDQYRVLHTSGTSGVQGIYIYDDAAWRKICLSMALSVWKPNQENLAQLFKGKIRTAFIGATGGHYTGVSYSLALPSVLCEVCPISINTPINQMVEILNEYKPHIIVGYANALHGLIEPLERGELKVNLKHLINSGEQLSQQTGDALTAAFGLKPMNFYISTEGVVGSTEFYDEPMKIKSDLTICEVVTEHGRSVNEMETGNVVLSNLCNQVFPMIRYQMNDQAQIGVATKRGHCLELANVQGRSYGLVPITSDSGERDALHSNMLVEFYLPTVEQFQFISNSDDLMTINYVSDEDRHREVALRFKRLLAEKQASNGTNFYVVRQNAIARERGGKRVLVKFDEAG